MCTFFLLVITLTQAQIKKSIQTKNQIRMVSIRKPKLGTTLEEKGDIHIKKNKVWSAKLSSKQKPY